MLLVALDPESSYPKPLAPSSGSYSCLGQAVGAQRLPDGGMLRVVATDRVLAQVGAWRQPSQAAHGGSLHKQHMAGCCRPAACHNRPGRHQGCGTRPSLSTCTDPEHRWHTSLADAAALQGCWQQLSLHAKDCCMLGTAAEAAGPCCCLV